MARAHQCGRPPLLRLASARSHVRAHPHSTEQASRAERQRAARADDESAGRRRRRGAAHRVDERGRPRGEPAGRRAPRAVGELREGLERASRLGRAGRGQAGARASGARVARARADARAAARAELRARGAADAQGGGLHLALRQRAAQLPLDAPRCRPRSMPLYCMLQAALDTTHAHADSHPHSSYSLSMCAVASSSRTISRCIVCSIAASVRRHRDRDPRRHEE